MIKLKLKNRKRRVGLMNLLALFRDLQTRHCLNLTENTVSPTTEFLIGASKELSLRLQADVTPTAAYLCWRLVFDLLDRIRQKHTSLADIAFWYGIDPFKLTETRQLALIANLPRVQAQDTLHAGRYDSTDYRGVFSLVLLATNDIKQAEAAQAAALERYVDQSIARNTRR